ncbi:glycoside hydrolase family 43 protein, partial [Periconia macrospinosa]
TFHKNVSSYVGSALYNLNGTWYSFGTFNGKDIQGARSSSLEGNWTKFGRPILAINETTWAGTRNGSYGTWAPDVFQRCSDNKFVMLVPTTLPKKGHHCIGAAIADTITGVYHPVNDFVQCNRTSSGVIDPAWFKDDDKRQYVVYKTDRPEVYLEIREVANSGPKEGVEWVGNAQKLLKKDAQGFKDGFNLEAPYIFKRGGVYFLAYSTHYYGDGSYDVQYATSKHVKGPYTRAKEPLLKTTDKFGCNITGPGSASFQRDSKGNEKVVNMIFHGLKLPLRPMRRELYTATVHVNGTKLYIK